MIRDELQGYVLACGSARGRGHRHAHRHGHRVDVGMDID